MTYAIQDRETGTIIEEVTTMQEAETLLAQYEADDRADGNYTPDFYEIVEA